MTRNVSPNELQSAAIAMMLGGLPPITREDWTLCANFWASNIAKGLEEAAVPLLGMLFECPLTKEELTEIARFQADRKG
jgi:hypothetical protein